MSFWMDGKIIKWGHWYLSPEKVWDWDIWWQHTISDIVFLLGKEFPFFIYISSIWFSFYYRFVDSEEVRSKFQVPNDMDTVLLFNENTSRPMTSVSMKDIPTSTLHHIISSNQYLTLPRLSSQVKNSNKFKIWL